MKDKRTSVYEKGVILSIAIFGMLFGFFPAIILADKVGITNFVEIYGFLYLGLGLFSLFLNCPKCGHNLFRGKYFYGPFPNRECQGCGLKLDI
jgi:hypothetical protein